MSRAVTGLPLQVMRWAESAALLIALERSPRRFACSTDPHGADPMSKKSKEAKKEKKIVIKAAVKAAKKAAKKAFKRIDTETKKRRRSHEKPSRETE
jgi:hypothetical protein